MLHLFNLSESTPAFYYIHGELSNLLSPSRLRRQLSFHLLGLNWNITKQIPELHEPLINNAFREAPRLPWVHVRRFPPLVLLEVRQCPHCRGWLRFWTQSNRNVICGSAAQWNLDHANCSESALVNLYNVEIYQLNRLNSLNVNAGQPGSSANVEACSYIATSLAFSFPASQTSFVYLCFLCTSLSVAPFPVSLESLLEEEEEATQTLLQNFFSISSSSSSRSSSCSMVTYPASFGANTY